MNNGIAWATAQLAATAMGNKPGVCAATTASNAPSNGMRPKCISAKAATD
jgi:hypothetical protein